MVRFGAGNTYDSLSGAVANHGRYAMESLPSQPGIGVVGSIITGTHSGSSIVGMIGENIIEFDIVFPDGTFKTINEKNTPNFKHYIMNFGGLGVIT